MGIYVPPGFLERQGTHSVTLVPERQVDVTRMMPVVPTAVPNTGERCQSCSGRSELCHQYTPLVKHPAELGWLFLPMACLSLGKRDYVPGE